MKEEGKLKEEEVMRLEEIRRGKRGGQKKEEMKGRRKKR